MYPLSAPGLWIRFPLFIQKRLATKLVKMSGGSACLMVHEKNQIFPLATRTIKSSVKGKGKRTKPEDDNSTQGKYSYLEWGGEGGGGRGKGHQRTTWESIKNRDAHVIHDFCGKTGTKVHYVPRVKISSYFQIMSPLTSWSSRVMKITDHTHSCGVFPFQK